jgi:AraC-like DNA-binding protein
MPVQRIVLAGDGRHAIERVQAPAHGTDWGPLHRSPNWRWILPGSGGIQWRGGHEELLVDELTAFHLASGDSYQLQHERGRAHVVLSTAQPDGPLPCGRGWLVLPRALFQLRLALRSLDERPDSTAAAAAAVRQALAQSTALPGTPSARAVLRARRFIAARPGAGHSIEQVGEEACCSPFHLSRLFARELGTTPHRYRTHLRLAAALAHLEAGERDLAGLAHELGFASQSHFGAVFHREVGVTPAAARHALRAR